MCSSDQIIALRVTSAAAAVWAFELSNELRIEGGKNSLREGVGESERERETEKRR